MKTLRFFLITCFALATLSSCEKQEELNPELVSLVAGNYLFSHVVADGQAYAIGQTNLSGRASVERKSAKSVKLAWSYKRGNSSYSGSYTGVSLSDAGTGEIELRYSGNLIATVSDGTLHIKVENSSGEQMVFVGSR
jgi:hypothetical protein